MSYATLLDLPPFFAERTIETLGVELTHAVGEIAVRRLDEPIKYSDLRQLRSLAIMVTASIVQAGIL